MIDFNFIKFNQKNFNCFILDSLWFNDIYRKKLYTCQIDTLALIKSLKTKFGFFFFFFIIDDAGSRYATAVTGRFESRSRRVPTAPLSSTGTSHAVDQRQVYKRHTTVHAQTLISPPLFFFFSLYETI